MWCGAGSTTSLTFAFLMGEAGTEALTERGAVRPGDHTHNAQDSTGEEEAQR